MKKTSKNTLLTRILTIFCELILIVLILYLLFVQFRSEINEEPLANSITATPTVEPNVIPEEEEQLPVEKPLPKQVSYNVPFTAQAPFGDWDDVLQDYGCEEACLLMAMAWVENKSITPQEARDQIVAISEFQLENYQHHHDTSVADTLKVLKDYFGYTRAFTKYDINLSDIKNELAQGNLVIIPINGNAVNNPYYTPPGPFQHQILVIGYDDDKQVLIAHDPGTRQGAAYSYPYDIIVEAIMDYESGLNEPIPEKRTAMLVIQPKDN